MRISRLARATLLVLFCANFLNFFDRQILAALAPLLKDHWQLSDAQVGLLATAFELTYALAPLPLAFLADRGLRRRIVALALLVWSSAMALTGAAVSYLMLLVGRAGLGLGQAGYGPSALAWLSDLFPASHRSRAVSVHDLALMIGSAAGFALGGVLGQAWGWRPVFWLAAVPGLALAAVLWFWPEPRKGFSDYLALDQTSSVTDAGREPPASFAATLRELLSIPTLRVTYATAILINLATSGIIYWLPSFAVRVQGLTIDRAGLIMGAMTVLAGGAGVLSGGWIADRWSRRNPAARLLTISASFALGCPLALLALSAKHQGLFILWATAAVYLFTFYFACLAPLIHQVTLPTRRATAMALYLLLAHILGNAVAPALIGWVSDQTGDLRLGMAAILALAFLGALIGFWGSRFVATDTRRMAEQLQASTSVQSAKER